MNEQLVVPEKSECERVIYAFGEIEKKFEDELEKQHGISHENRHPYHSLRHSKLVRDKSLAVFDRIKNVTPWVLLDMDKSEYDELKRKDDDVVESRIKVQRAYLSMLAMGHDIVQNGFIKSDGTFTRFRGVLPGQNEHESAARMVREINDLMGNDKEAMGYLETMQINSDRIFCDVNATFPEFDPKAKLPDTEEEALKITQPYLFEASMSGKIMALCDLYAPYSDVQSDATAEFWSDAEFWEIHPSMIDIARNIDNEKIDNSQDPRIKMFVSEIKSWISRQEGFIRWLDQTFISNLNRLEEESSGMYKEAVNIIEQAMPVERHSSLARMAAERKQILDRFMSNTTQQGMSQLKERLKILLVAMNYYDLDLDKIKNHSD